MEGKLIQVKMKELGITQSELAEKLGVSQPAVNSYFNSKDVRTSTLEKLCEVLNLTINYFYVDTKYGVTSVDENSKDVVLDLVLTNKEQLAIIKEQSATISRLTQIIEELKRDKGAAPGAAPNSDFVKIG